jgi:hypothetical protein
VDVKQSKTKKLRFNYRPPERLNTVGASVGVSIDSQREPGFTGTVQGTYAPQSGGFFELGMDIGLGTFFGFEDYFSLHPFIRYAYFLPFAKASTVGGGWYIGGGVGFFFDTATGAYRGTVTTTAFTVNWLSTGFIFRGGFTVSLDNFIGLGSVESEDELYRYDGRFVASFKLSVGYSYRFKEK